MLNSKGPIGDYLSDAAGLTNVPAEYRFFAALTACRAAGFISARSASPVFAFGVRTLRSMSRKLLGQKKGMFAFAGFFG